MADTPTSSDRALRQRAEDRCRASEAGRTETLSPEEAKDLLHSLQVHQIELEMQNEELRRVQSELERSRARYFDLYDLAPVGYLTLSEQGLIQEANLAAATMLGVTRGALLHKPITQIIFKEDQDTYYLHRKQLRGSCDQQACEVRLVRRDGTIFWAHLTATRQDTDSTPTLRIVVSDISERKQAEETLLETNSRLLEATATAHEMAAKSEAASQVKSRFLANMSHELRTPLTGVLGMLELALLGNLEAEQREFISAARTSAHTLVQILNDILDLTKIEMGKFSTEAKPFSLRKCLKDTFSILIPLAKSKGLALNLTVADDVPEAVVGDKLRLNQVLTNLAGNAVKFTKKGKVELRVSAGASAPGRKRDVTFTVVDTGIGIPDDKKDLLFRNFSQVDESHSRCYGGTGLGLAISKYIVGRLGGTISFTSEEGKGSTFSCTIPLGEAEPECATTDASEKPATPAYVPCADASRKARILIAEDDPAIKEILRNMFRIAKYETDFAENGQKAVEMWESKIYDLIIMDMQMPLLNGFEATAAIREKEQTRGGHIPIVAMTAHAFKEDRERCLAAGMDAYLSKPIDFHLTLQVIREILKDRSAVQG